MSNAVDYKQVEVGQLVDNANGTYTYTDENGVSTVIDASRAAYLSNGMGEFGSNYGLSAFTFDPVYLSEGSGSFLHSGGSATKIGDRFISVDPQRYYTLNMWAMSGEAGGANYDPTNKQYIGLSCYDAAKANISPNYFTIHPGSTRTTLAADLNNGDSTMTLTDATGWNNAGTGSGRHIVWWPYSNVYGHFYPEYTYSRNSTRYQAPYQALYDGPGLWGSGGIAGNVVTLTANWPGGTLPAGTPVQNSSSGLAFKYIAMSNVTVPNAWTEYRGSIGGVDIDGSNAANIFPPGTAFVKMLFLVNQVGNQNIRFSDIWLREDARSLVLRSPNGSPYRISVSDAGVISATLL